VAGRDPEAACAAVEELEATARLALLTRGMGARTLDASTVARVVERFDVDWDDGPGGRGDGGGAR
jgi:ribulose-5-phosphate 4-epimerase/fuculose-1-phosphate aldolase